MAQITGDAGPLRVRGRPNRSRWLLVIALFVGVAVAAVASVVVVRTLRPGSQGVQAVVPAVTAKPTAPSAPSDTPAPTTTSDPRADSVIQAYVDANSAFLHALLNPNPSDPGLAATQTGAARIDTAATLAVQQTLHITFRGTIVIGDVKLVSLQDTTAVVTSCDVDTTHAFNAQGQPVNARTGQPMPPGYDATRAQYNKSTATLVFTDGAWKVRDNILDVVSGCPTG